MDEVTPEMLAMARRIYAEYVKAKVIEQAGDFDPERIEAIIRGESDITHGVQIALAAIKETSEAQRPQPSGGEIERVTKAILFEDCGNTDGWQDNTNLGRAALAAMDREPKSESGWIVGNGPGTLWRTWEHGMPGWTDDRDKAIRYARREDAEMSHAEDDDAWTVSEYCPLGKPGK